MKLSALALILAAATVVDLANIPGCLPKGTTKTSGFTANFYPYTMGDSTTMSDLDYVLSGYKNNEIIASASGILDISFDWVNKTYPLSMVPHTYNLYGVPITITNFTVELTGYYYAATEGDYTFKLTQIDDSAAVFLGDGSAFDCCKTNPSVDPSDFMIYTYKIWGGSKRDKEATVNLAADTYYPIRIVYTNAEQRAILSATVTPPNGVSHSIEADTYFFGDLGYDCPAPPVSSTAFVSPSAVPTPLAVVPLAEVVETTSSETTSSETTSSVTTSSETTSTSTTSSSTTSSSTTSSSSSTETSSTTSSSSSLTPSSTSSPEVSSTTIQNVTSTATDIATVVVTITSCSDDKCHEVPKTTGQIVVTETVDETVSVYTTYCPLTSDTTVATVTEASTVVVTVTSCSDNKCSAVPKTTGQKVVTTTIDEVVSVYTTYCPLTSESPVETIILSSSSSSSLAPVVVVETSTEAPAVVETSTKAPVVVETSTKTPVSPATTAAVTVVPATENEYTTSFVTYTSVVHSESPAAVVASSSSKGNYTSPVIVSSVENSSTIIKTSVFTIVAALLTFLMASL